MVTQEPRLRKKILIEGWRGINHSLALVNQHQILELLKNPALKLFHHDLPFAFNHWRRTDTGSGFASADCALINQVPALGPGETVDCVYRIGSPVRPGGAADTRRTATFMIAEIGFSLASFIPGAATLDFYTRDENFIITSTRWSRDRLADFGFAPHKIEIVPLGVDLKLFQPLEPFEREAARVALGFGPDETVFVNVGVALWNKGIDLVLRAFATLRARGRRVRLVLKDQRDVYGIPLDQTLAQAAAQCAALNDPATLGAISVISDKLERTQLRALYSLADAYVSPYRAEGFNLPVLEAMACGTPVIVTQGGATDDFCDDTLALRVPGKLLALEDAATGLKGRYIEPDFEALVAAMERVAAPAFRRPEAYEENRRAMLEKFNWPRAAARLAALLTGQPEAGEAPKTFDVFDTLIARRCIEPWRIFEQAGQNTGHPDFLRARLAAEAALAGGDYTFQDIYASLGRQCQLTPQAAGLFSAAELAAELENVIPIQENLEKLRDGDVLVSDMYLPETVIRDLLGKAGLNKQVGLVVSTQGKRQGHIWPLITGKLPVRAHLGDHPLADVEMPRKFGILGTHTGVSAPDATETWLAQAGLPGLSRVVREARLRSWHADPAFRNLQKIQAQINLPILLLSTAQLLRVAAETGAERLLFCSRDCDLWLALYEALAPRLGAPAEAVYFYTSRIARRQASADYLAYARELLGARGLVVDACGTGWSIAHLFNALGLEKRDVFFIHHCHALDVYEEHDPTPDTCTIHAVIHPERYIPNVGIEMVNTAAHGSVLDVRKIAGANVPVFDKEWPSARLRAAITLQRDFFIAMLPLLENLRLSEIFDLPAARIAVLAQALYEHLHAQPELRVEYLPAYCAETVEVHARLKIRLP